MMNVPFPSKTDWLTPLWPSLFPERFNVLETEGKIRASWLWLVLEKNSFRPLPPLRNRIVLQLEQWMSDVQTKRIVLDFPSFGTLVEGYKQAGRFDKTIVEPILNLYREPDGGYRLTPDSRVESMECLWWGMRIDRQCFVRNIQTFAVLEEKMSSYESKNGGYGPRPGAIPDLPSTGMALDILLNAHPRLVR